MIVADFGLKAAALIIMIYCIVVAGSHHAMRSRHYREFMLLCCDMLFCSGIALLFMAFSDSPWERSTNMARMIFETIYALVHGYVGYLFLLYLMQVLGLPVLRRKRRMLLILLPQLFLSFLEILNLFIPVVFRFSAGGAYTHCILWPLMIFIPGAYFMAAVLILVYYHNAFPSHIRLFFTIGLCMIVFGVFMQNIFSMVKIELFSESICILILLLTLESGNRRIHMETGVQNRRSLQNNLRRLTFISSPFAVIDISVGSIFGRWDFLDQEQRRALEREIAGVLCECADDREIYHYGFAHFDIVIPELTRGDEQVLIQNIRHRLQKVRVLRDAGVNAKPVIVSIRFPEAVDSLNEITSLLAVSGMVHTDDYENPERILASMQRVVLLEHAILQSVENKTCRVLFQPILSVQNHTAAELEALCRIESPVLGTVEPDEFIPIAEHNGAIDALGRQMLEQCCRIVQQYHLEDAGIRQIHLNVSIYQFMNDAMPQQYAAIVKKWGLQPSLFALELNAAGLPEGTYRVENIVDALQQMGFSVIFDHFGSSSANLRKAISQNIDGVKIDHQVLRLAMEDENRRDLLQTIIRSLRDYKKTVCQSGVETQRELQFVQSSGADYMQGYLICRPLREEETEDWTKNNAKGLKNDIFSFSGHVLKKRIIPEESEERAW